MGKVPKIVKFVCANAGCATKNDRYLYQRFPAQIGQMDYIGKFLKGLGRNWYNWYNGDKHHEAKSLYIDVTIVVRDRTK